MLKKQQPDADFAAVADGWRVRFDHVAPERHRRRPYGDHDRQVEERNGLERRR
jgi:anti-sigma-K factor RskA